MINITFCLLAIALYCTAIVIGWRHYMSNSKALVDSPQSNSDNKSSQLWLIRAGIVTHALSLRAILWTTAGFDVHIMPLFSLIVLAILVAVVAIRHLFDQHLITFTLLPLAIFSVLLILFIKYESIMLGHLQTVTIVHIISSILAYSILSIAALLAMQIFIQHALLKRQKGSHLVNALPLTASENLMFQTIKIGVFLLSISLISGFLFVENLFAQHLIHKTILSLLAWALFTFLLLGRWRYGWRGMLAIKMTLAGMFVLLLGYFGSKFVLEVILQRAWQL